MKTPNPVLAVLTLAAACFAQTQPKMINAQLQTRSAAAGLEREVRGVIASQTAPAWVGYSVPIVAGNRMMCCSYGDGNWGSCRLESGHGDGVNIVGEPPTVRLEGARSLIVMFRVEQKSVEKFRTFTEDCLIDAGNLPLYWFNDVKPDESVAWLASQITVGDNNKKSSGPLSAIALHATPAADQALERMIHPSQPEALREKVTFWLGNARGKRGYEILRQMAQNDPSERVRDQVTFAFSQSKEPQALESLIGMAKNDKSTRVRGQALFWLAQKAGAKAAGAITDAIENDPETAVKEKAVFALSQLPKDEGVPMLIQVARTNRNPAVRKKAIFWLGQSKDPRSLVFFEEVLTK